MNELTFHAILTVLKQIVRLVQMGGISLIQLNYRDSKPIYEQIKDGLRKLVISSSLTANEKLPSVRELASTLAINPNTIQKAYRDLEGEGYIYTVAGKGTFVAEQQEIFNVRQQELLGKFDEVVEELFFLSVDEAELKERMTRLARGGEHQ